MFTEKDVIFAYTDKNAVDDGLLVAVGPRDRVTRTLWEALCERAPESSKPPNRWPVDLMGWFQAENVKKEDALKLIAKYGAEEGQRKLNQIIADRKALALSKGIIGTHARAAVRAYELNTDGGIYKLYAVMDKAEKYSELMASLPLEGSLVYSTFWLLPNENAGVTLMFPEDY